MTDREIVLAKYPEAREWKPLGGDGLVCICRDSIIIGEAYSADGAWAAAARNIKEKGQC